jgi:hypothetical protein
VITYEEGPDEGTRALHQSACKGQHHGREMSLEEHQCRMSHLAGGEARLEEVPNLG